MNRFLQLLPLGLLVLASCLPPQAGPATHLPSAEAAFMDLEEHLLTASPLRLRFRVQAEGAFTAEIDGELLLEDSDIVQLTASGIFGDTPIQLYLHAAEGHMQGGSSQRSFEGPAPDHLRTALVLGLTRMGILHNLARLTGGQPPDHADANVREWVVPREVAWLEPAADENHSPSGLRFAIEVAGERAAEASLWLDAGGWPRRRTQTVHFPGGEMQVTEEYEVLSDVPGS